MNYELIVKPTTNNYGKIEYDVFIKEDDNIVQILTKASRFGVADKIKDMEENS